MTAPTYTRFPATHPFRLGLLRWAWEVTDGYTGPVLATGTTRTRRGAQITAAFAAAGCEPALSLRLQWIADRLRREGLPVVARLDEQDRVCVRALCPCSRDQHLRVMQQFFTITRAVRWEGSR
ncbi:hypothetical protein Ait01nite_031720 [Actinoplanes italicus]|uniref:Uncharacterized protein n=1 Tax=Actinoplanes italicus TaxID=113567 RepID=A0A2T0KJD3_9ACTN|nr:hypothetical protein [Actinoplanes italicus]PRX23627.1 hypothetical protein CLV67_103376 [Actinoplanes italicus]GIE30127.1 hypothetical protein Ait01nite_031720 [Actinoplanes italicus]